MTEEALLWARMPFEGKMNLSEEAEISRLGVKNGELQNNITRVGNRDWHSR